MIKILLKAHREKSVIRRHPWIFSGAIERIEGTPHSGETVSVFTRDGNFLAKGAYSPASQIKVRLWTFNADEQIDATFFRTRLERAIQYRRLVSKLQTTNAYRLVNSESDGLPGLIVDRYSDFLVCQFTSAGTEMWKAVIVNELNQLLPECHLFERSDLAVRQMEGLSESIGVLQGQAPPELVEIQEGACRFYVDLIKGQKTGFYLDQRANRLLVAQYAEGLEVLNCFAYTGGFGVHALRGGAKHVLNIETSARALEIANQQMLLNQYPSKKVDYQQGDAFKILRSFRDAGRTFDLIILDPPKFAESKSQLGRATRGYKDINLLAFKLLNHGGFLFTFSCSGLVSPELFQKIVADAALDADREIQIIQFLSQDLDHPVALNFPEGRYLKGLLCRGW